MPDAPVTTRFWWIRHAPVINPGGAIYGALDVAADTSDRAAFEALAAALPERAAWVTSTLTRTHRTADAIQDAAGRRVAPAREADLAEQHMGAWQGRPRDEVYAALGRRHPFWLAPAATRPPEGESFVDLIGRVRPAIERLAETHGGGDVIAVAHGGTIRAAVAIALDLDPEAALRLTVDTLSLTRLDRLVIEDGTVAWRVGAINLPPRRPSL
ncbi:MAG: histidine phosphatase family protein [Azospirillaceae bacterium]